MGALVVWCVDVFAAKQKGSDGAEHQISISKIAVSSRSEAC